MQSKKRTSSMRRTLAPVLFAFVVALAGGPSDARAQTTAAAEGVPNQVRLLLDLLADPTVKDWVEQRRAEGTAKADTASDDRSETKSIASQIDAVGRNIGALVDAAPRVADEVDRVWTSIFQQFAERGLVRVILLIIGFVGLGFGVQKLFYWATKAFREWFVRLPLDTVSQRLNAVGIRLAYGLGLVAAFAIGTLGAFMPFTWPPLLRDIVFQYLLAFLVLRLALVAGRFLLAPGGPRFRIVPMETSAAWFWHWRLVLFGGWIAFVVATMQLLDSLNFQVDARRFIGIFCFLVLFGIATEAAWRRPRPAGISADQPVQRPRTAWLATGYFVFLFLLFIAGISARPLFWLAVLAAALPIAIGVTRRSVNHLLRPPGGVEAEIPSLTAVCLDRGLQSLMIIGAAIFLAGQWGIDLVALTTRDTIWTRLARGGISAVVVILIADFVWHVLKTLIDRKLVGFNAEHRPDEEEIRHRARMRTLLPIVRNLVFVVLMVMAVLMVLAALGIDIGPLIAGAGVVGVAIGFAAQTLVKDVISGIFYLIDDAFRVGEYIQSTAYKGVVESFSLRSVKLRHHRGPLYTVPFGTLGAVQNMSRDWVIDKMTIGVTYDSDIDQAKKLIKQVGQQLLAVPEFAPNIIETIKMQGVENFGHFAVNLRLKMTTKPGEQFVIRRYAFALIKKAFDANGIKFAYSTVQIAGGDNVPLAAAKTAIDLVAAPPKSA